MKRSFNFFWFSPRGTLVSGMQYSLILRKPHQFTRKKNNTSNGSKSTTCHNCGGIWPHKTTACPARGKDCRKCGKLNHFAKYCRSTKPLKESEAASQPQKQRHTVQNVQNRPASDTDDEEQGAPKAREAKRPFN